MKVCPSERLNKELTTHFLAKEWAEPTWGVRANKAPRLYRRKKSLLHNSTESIQARVTSAFQMQKYSHCYSPSSQMKPQMPHILLVNQLTYRIWMVDTQLLAEAVCAWFSEMPKKHSPHHWRPIQYTSCPYLTKLPLAKVYIKFTILSYRSLQSSLWIQ